MVHVLFRWNAAWLGWAAPSSFRINPQLWEFPTATPQRICAITGRRTTSNRSRTHARGSKSARLAKWTVKRGDGQLVSKDGQQVALSRDVPRTFA